MKTILIVLIVLNGVLFVGEGWAQAPNWAWAKPFGGLSDDNSYGIAVDAIGNVYTTGSFNGTVDFDPGSGTFNLASPGVWSVYILKLDSASNFIWAKKLGGSGFAGSNAIILDGSDNVYIAGNFTGTIDFDPGPSVYNLSVVQPSGNCFVTKLDSAGNFVWTTAIDLNDLDYCYSIALDGINNVYLTGITGSSWGGYSQMYICQLNASGNIFWIKFYNGSSNGHCSSASLAADALGNVYITGWFTGIMDFISGTGTFSLTAIGLHDVFVLKLSSSGSFIWAKQIGGTNQAEGNSIVVDNSGSVYLTGKFVGTIDFDPGPGTFNMSAPGNQDFFITKLDSSGNFIWAKAMGSTAFFDVSDIALDAAYNVYTTGSFQGSADFDPGAGVFNMTSAGTQAVFISKLSNAGNFIWAKSIDGSNPGGQALVLDYWSNLYVTGLFGHNILFDTINLLNADTTGSSIDIFIAKLDNNIITSINNARNNPDIIISPNPTTNTCTIAHTNTSTSNTLRLYDLTGRIMLQQPFNSTAQIDVSKFARGMYIAEVRDKDGVGVKGKLVKE